MFSMKKEDSKGTILTMYSDETFSYNYADAMNFSLSMNLDMFTYHVFDRLL